MYEDRYYRVRMNFPIPPDMMDLLGPDMPMATASVFDSRFYTKATNLRDVYLDIRKFMCMHYAPKGYNEYDDFEETEQLNAGLADPVMALRLYENIQMPHVESIEVISDPDQVEMIGSAIDLMDKLKAMGSFGHMLSIFPEDWKPLGGTLGEVIEHLEHALRHVLNAHRHVGDGFESLGVALDLAHQRFNEVYTLAQENRKKLKELQA